MSTEQELIEVKGLLAFARSQLIIDMMALRRFIVATEYPCLCGKPPHVDGIVCPKCYAAQRIEAMRPMVES